MSVRSFCLIASYRVLDTPPLTLTNMIHQHLNQTMVVMEYEILTLLKTILKIYQLIGSCIYSFFTKARKYQEISLAS